VEDRKVARGKSLGTDKGMDSIHTVTNTFATCTSITSTDHKGQVHSQQAILVLSQLIFRQSL
jgi:hypothetical protein